MRAELVIIRNHNYKSITYKQVNCLLTWLHKIQTTIELDSDLTLHRTPQTQSSQWLEEIWLKWPKPRTKVGTNNPIPFHSRFPFPYPASWCSKCMKVEEKAAAKGRQLRWIRSSLLCSALRSRREETWDTDAALISSQVFSRFGTAITVQCVQPSWCCSHK